MFQGSNKSENPQSKNVISVMHEATLSIGKICPSTSEV